MRKSWMTRACAPLACAALLTACGDKPEQAPAAAALVSLSGCLEAAPGSNRYVLRSVRFEPRAGDPHANTTTPGGHGITEGAWVRVDGGSQDLTGFLGQRVMVKAAITDDGRNTIGTAGTPGVQTPTGDPSQAASPEHHSDKQKKEMGRIARESMADGMAAEVKVQEVSGTGDRCTPPQPEKR